MVENATYSNLKKAFKNHLKGTKTQMSRLEAIFDELNIKPSGKTCKAKEGLIREAKCFITLLIYNYI